MNSRIASRLAWSMWAGFILLGTIAFLLARRNSSQLDQLFLAAPFLYLTVGAVVASRRSSNPVGWILCTVGFVPSLYTFAREYGRYALLTSPGTIPGGDVMAWLSTWIVLPTITLGATFLLLLFPNGRLPSHRWKPVAWVAAGAIVLFAIGPALSPGTLEGFAPHTNPFGVEALGEGAGGAFWLTFALIPILAIASVSSLVVRFRRSRGSERQQLKWFLFACATTIVVFPLLTFGIPIRRLPDLFFLIVTIGLLSLIPLSVGVAILRHRLFDIDVVINKTIVYGALALFLTGVYLGLVVGVGAWVAAGSQYNLPLSVLATAIVALVFQPLRTRLQKIANRMVYGKRATPYEAMSEFSKHMAGSLSFEEVLPRMAEAAARGIGATGTRVRVFLPDGEERSASWPAGSAEGAYERTVPVIHQSETVGEIAAAKAPNDPITPAEEKLLEDLASQAGPAMRNVRLTEDLRASRARIVAAQDQERRRLGRDIHDGAQQQLVSMAIKLGLVGGLLDKDPAKAANVVEELKGEASAAVETLRDLARGIFPQLLADQGLVAALEAHLAKADISKARVVSGLTGGARFDLQIEGAIYFSIREALQNASKHAEGAPVIVALSQSDGFIEFSVRDEGPGFDVVSARRGSGLQNMADRIEALGGTFEIDSVPGKGADIKGRIPANAVETPAP